jgi:triacylglycerol lipase
MSANTPNPFDASSLLGTPVMRAAYSDRTAWLMSAMSELAYYQFEDKELVSALATELAELSDINDIKNKLTAILTGTVGGGDEQTLRDILNLAKFELIRTYNRAGTQAFMAKRTGVVGKGMLVLAFRGTEIVPADIYSDVDAVLVTLDGEEKVHRGFLNAFGHVKDIIQADLESYPDIPVYITGHSLGGALAILATRLLASSSQGACYTFGGPRVGTSQVDDEIKTPIYRVVNSADAVPRVPPEYLINLFILISNIFHITIISKFLRKFKGYVHYGDMRYLTHVEPGIDDHFAGLQLHSNPSFPTRAYWVVRRWIATSGKAAGSDHSISLYRKKLKAYAIERSKVGKLVVPPETGMAPEDVEEKDQ